MGQPFDDTGTGEPMDVTCERCSTEYEFDDALVSERGTTVQCTNCGFRFKVRRTDGALPERWVVRTVDGRELEFTMLRELQAAIAQGDIRRDDVLSRGSSRPRRLGNIAELEPFFGSLGGPIAAHTVQGIGGSARVRSQTPQGLGVPPPDRTESSVAIPLPAPPDEGPESLSESKTVVMSGRTPLPALPFSRTPSAPPPPPISDPVASPAGRAPIMPGALPGIVVPPDDEAPPLPDGYAGGQREPAAPAKEPAAAKAAPRADGDAARADVAAEERAAKATAITAREVAPPTPEPPSADERGGRRPAHTMTPTPADVRASFFEEGYAEPRFSSLAPSKRSSGAARWIVGFVVAGFAVLAAVTLGPKYLKPSAPGPVKTSDERIATLIQESEKSVLDGDLETARDKIVKASALAEDDPRLAASLAKLDTVRADQRWLQVRLLAEGDAGLPAAQNELKLAAERARKAVDQASKVAPRDPAALRASIDLLRIEGNLDAARKQVGALSEGSAQPENALTLAALDLAEAQPSWAAVIERLRAAAGGEQNLGRARALLIYALVRSGDAAGAKAELDRLAGMSRPHPLAASLRAFLERTEESAGKKPAAASSATPAAGGAQPAARPAEPPRGGPARRPKDDDDGGRVPDDFAVGGDHVDTSDLPGVAQPPTTAPTAPPTAAPTAQPPPASTTPPAIDTSDLPGNKP